MEEEEGWGEEVFVDGEGGEWGNKGCIWKVRL
jgi:hypothetical protein